jgi:putative transposase
MPGRLHRSYGAHHLHFVPCSCCRRLPSLRRARSRDCFLSILEQGRYRFVIVGYVVMPEHIHLLITNRRSAILLPSWRLSSSARRELCFPSASERTARTQPLWRGTSATRVLAGALLRLQRVDHKKRVEKLRYMHRNPVKRALLASPEQWRWSSYRFYLFDEAGSVSINVGWTEISFRDRVA